MSKAKNSSGDARDYAFQSYFHVQDLARSVSSLDDPVVKRALEMIKRFPTQRNVIDNNVRIVERHLRAKLKVRQKFPDPFEPNPLDKNVDGEVSIGKVRQTDASFGLHLEELKQHTLITGRSGCGKSSIIYLMMLRLLELGIPFLAFDFKRDYRHLMKYFDDVHVFSWKNFKLNPLRPPLGCEPVKWMQAFNNVFGQAYHLLAGGKGIIQEDLFKLYEDYGVFKGRDIFPSLQDLYETVKRHPLPRKYGREAGFVESAINRLSECIIPLRDMLDCDRGFCIEDLLDRTVVFELDGLLSQNQTFLVMLLLRFIFEYRIAEQRRQGLKHVIFFDEGKMVYDKKRDYEPGMDVNEIVQFTSQIREFGEGLVVADQMPQSLSDSIKSNVHTLICMSQSHGRNTQEMAAALHLTSKDQVIAFKKLISDEPSGVFEALVTMSGRWPMPFIIRVSPFAVEKKVSDQEIEERMEPLLEELGRNFVPRTEYGLILAEKKKQEEEKKAEERKLRKEEAEQHEAFEGNILIKILTNIKDHPFIDQKTRIEMLGLGSSSSTTSRYFKELVARGYVTKCSIGLGRGKSTVTLYEITEKGMEFAKISRISIPGKGDFAHKYWQHTIKEFYQSLSYNAEIEKRFGFKNVDIGFEMDGKRTAVEVELSPDHLIENIQRDLDSGCEQIIIAAPSKAKVNSYRKKMESVYSREVLDKLDFRPLTDFIS